eukprot:CAMPEP_0201479010 /NCGR_PEP_ID=MMETSP0151_2-20130828/3753_1 /ASSEMBLY_ACC=CAM_ASM_000257 /TAXON_ID=200890 /ORGANISM="Paramoeba atlantica, Strain 621/1 / CCAP 1560/9" /LENGTH=334 /DNA_ID=CAMNT_0047860315 /DNA_START=75 /DNA_END=1079 /DNA_ORIENTATION=-
MMERFVLTLVFCFGLVFAQVPPSERDALVDFYTSLRGQDWNGNANWLTGDPCQNSWSGVFCNPEQTNVEQLIRQSQRLNGTIPDSIGNLTQLNTLFISFNPHLVGTLPPFYVGMESLSSLTLEANGLSGSIPPNLGQAPNLNSLWLTENFTGTIPDDLFGAPYQFLTISSTQIEGTVPAALCKSPPTLEYLYLSQTQLSGTFPDCLDNFPQLSEFFCSDNSISGTIPSSLSKLPKLTEVEMYDNKLTGSLPEFVSTNLFLLAFSQNELVGTIPDYNVNFVNETTSYLYLSSNQLTGTIPEWVCGLASCHVQKNQFQCPEPSCCGTGFITCDACQ